MVNRTTPIRTYGFTTETERKEYLKLIRPKSELGFLPILHPFGNCPRSMLESDTFTLSVQINSALMRIKEVKGTAYDISNLLESHEEISITCL
jgi:hypothetical protein